jgi:Fic family protein
MDLIRKLYVTLHPDEGDVKTVKYRRDIPQHRLYFHEYAPPDKIALKLRALVDWLNAPESLKAAGHLKLAAKVHYDLARIYPFPKDSGKVARLLMNLLLMRAGYPPAVMHHSERQRYYDALKAPTAQGLVQMVRDAVENSISSIEKLLDDRARAR